MKKTSSLLLVSVLTNCLGCSHGQFLESKQDTNLTIVLWGSAIVEEVDAHRKCLTEHLSAEAPRGTYNIVLNTNAVSMPISFRLKFKPDDDLVKTGDAAKLVFCDESVNQSGLERMRTHFSTNLTDDRNLRARTISFTGEFREADGVEIGDTLNEIEVGKAIQWKR